MLDSYPRRVTNGPVGAIEVWPGCLDRPGILVAVKRFQVAAKRARLGGRRLWDVFHKVRRFLADVGNPVQAGLHAPAAGGEIHGAVGVDDQVRDREWSAFDENVKGGG